MFVITRSLGKCSGDRRLSDSDMPPAKAQRRQVRREKKNILTKDFHVFSPTFAALASLREIFRVSVTVVRRRRTSFSQPSLGKSVYYYSLKFAQLAQTFRELNILGLGYSSRQDAKTPSSEKRLHSSNEFTSAYPTFAPWRLCGRSSGVRLRLCRAVNFVVKRKASVEQERTL